MRFEGDEGWVETGDAQRLEVSPASLKTELRKLRTMRVMAGTTAASHGRDFFDAIKTRGLTHANQHVMRHSHIACHAAAMCWLPNRKLRFDPATESFIDDPEADCLRSRAHRQPYRL